MKNNRKYLLAILSIALIFSSCIKNDFVKLGDTGTPRVSFQEAPGGIQYLSAFTGTKNVDLFTLIRDEVSSSAVNQSYTVTISISAAGLTTYNTENGTDYLQLAESSFTPVPGLGITAKGGGQYDVTFAPGVTNIPFSITINSATWNFAGVNAAYFTIANANGKGVKSGKGEMMSAVGVKNKYDGTYRLDGAFYHPSSSPGYDPFTINVEMHTSGPDKVKLYVPDFGGYYSPGLFAGVLNAFGAQEPEFTIDPITNQVTVQNAAAGAATFYQMAPGYDSHYDPVAKKIYAKWGYNYSPGPVFNPATNREWTDVFTYLGPR